MTSKRGFSAERELVRKLWSMGFAAIRAPASGSKVKHSVYPDVVAIRRGRVLVFEVKSRSKLEAIYIPRSQVEKLKEFARRAGGRAYVAIKIKNQGWRIVPLDKLTPMGDDKYKVDVTVIATSQDLNSFAAQFLNEKLDKFLPNKAGDQTGKLSSQETPSVRE